VSVLTQESAQVEDSHPRWFVQPSRQLSKSRRCSGMAGVVFSTTREWRLKCHLRDASWDGDEEPDADNHKKGNGEVAFRVSGRLTAENLAEMETLFAAETKGRRIVLGCTDLRSVHGEAVKFLEKCEADSIKLKNCGLYIREWIRRKRLERKSGKSPGDIRNERVPFDLSVCSGRSIMVTATQSAIREDLLHAGGTLPITDSPEFWTRKH